MITVAYFIGPDLRGMSANSGNRNQQVPASSDAWLASWKDVEAVLNQMDLRSQSR
jgi:hypothetical protein